MSQKIRLGNDINISWSLMDEEQAPYIVEGRDVSIEIIVGGKKRVRIKEFTLEGNTVNFTYYGKDQKYAGKCDLKYIENDGEVDMVTFDTKDAFTMVEHSWLAIDEGETPEAIQLEFVTVVSSLLSKIGPRGYSAYEIAVQNGFIGTEEEWLQSLVGEKGEKGDPGTTDYNDLANKPTIPDELSDLSDDADHRLVTDAEKSAWSAKYNKPSGGIPSTDMTEGVQQSLGRADSAYQKPGSGIPGTDLESAVQTSLGKADTAYQKPSGGIPKTDLASGVQESLGKADASATQSEMDSVTAKIPSQASAQNQLADKEFVNSSIATATATHRGTYNLVSDLSLTTSATEQQIAAAIATKLAALSITADNNDYVFVQIPTADATPTETARVDRYKYNGTVWSFEFSLNNSGFTAAQWASINSGITSALVAAFNAKYDKPSGGIPNGDLAGDIAKNKLASDVQTSLGKADNAAPQSTTYTKTEVDTELAKKADKDTDAVEGNLSKFDANGNPIDSGIPADEIGNLSLRINALELNANDLSMRDINGERTYIRNTANSYVVHSAGEYCIPLVYGNGIKKGKQNTPAWTRKGSTYTADFVNHLGNAITDAYIEKNDGCVPASAALLWQTANGVVTNVKLARGEDCTYLQFTVSSVPTTNADVLLAVKDANGDVMWSWMIWAVSDTLGSFKLKNYTNVEYEMLSLPLGAIWNANRDHYVVPHFQWGRKDPMCPPSAYKSNSNMTLNDISGNTVSVQSYGVADDSDAGGTVRSVANSIKMPNKFFMEYDATNYHWNNLTNFNNFWNANETTNSSLADNQDTAIKTIYDPNLPGWTLPSGRFATGFTTTGSNTSTASQFNVIGSWSNGWNFKKDSTDTDGVYFPASGRRDSTSGALGNVGSDGYWWSFAPNSQASARYLSFNSGYVRPLNGYYRAVGFGVWPCRELN